MWDTPIFINSCNRYEPLLHQVTWLLKAGYENITILDNASSYPPLLDYLSAVSKHVAVIGLAQNVGKFALWRSGVIEIPEPPFVYTDPDVVPDANCPNDILAVFMQALERHPNKRKCGFGLRIDDLPECYAPRETVIAWESQFWTKPIRNNDMPCELFNADIDTTFALYLQRQFTPSAIRTGPPYVARHLTWYLDSSNPTKESVHYEQTSTVSGTWKLNGSTSGPVNEFMNKLDGGDNE